MTLSKPIPSFAKNFPASTASPSFYFNFPGCTPQSTAAVREAIEENDRRHDIYEKARCESTMRDLPLEKSFD